MTPAILLLCFVTVERLAELWLAKRNTAGLLAQGAFEIAPGHYPLIVALHSGWLITLWWLGWAQMLQPAWVVVFAILQALRVWVLVSLGPRWTTRIIILPNAPLVRTGPYRFFSHPNYAVVVGEIAVLPLCFGLPMVAFVFSVLNAAVLFIRIRAESGGLGRSVKDT